MSANSLRKNDKSIPETRRRRIEMSYDCATRSQRINLESRGLQRRRCVKSQNGCITTTGPARDSDHRDSALKLHYIGQILVSRIDKLLVPSYHVLDNHGSSGSCRIFRKPCSRRSRSRNCHVCSLSMPVSSLYDGESRRSVSDAYHVARQPKHLSGST